MKYTSLFFTHRGCFEGRKLMWFCCWRLIIERDRVCRLTGKVFPQNWRNFITKLQYRIWNMKSIDLMINSHRDRPPKSNKKPSQFITCVNSKPQELNPHSHRKNYVEWSLFNDKSGSDCTRIIFQWLFSWFHYIFCRS